MAKDPDLLAQIERGALNDAVSLASLLRKCVALGGATRSAELRDWASDELNGYRDDTKIPEYRIVHAPILADGRTFTHQITGQQISSWDLPDFAREHITNEVRLARGVGEAVLSNAARNGETVVRLQPPGAADLVTFMNSQQGGGIERIYWGVSIGQIAGTLDQIRTTLVRLASEMRAAQPAGTAMPSHEAATEAVHVVLHGGTRNVVNINTAQARDGSNATVMATPTDGKEPGGSKAATIWTVAGVVVAIVSAYFTYRQWRG
ncbi:hypothetical protein GA0070216_1015 [Micromonospora matsumotoense]|uniref:AbiTii domain-containing protein n=1 Tax=Micromonospora matsumotoense TaxID=121616 RepID=A0A1C4TVP1_9ACTN|nr:hypothetical protein [Micromonospora matsumotoense]SCE63508.1 hypothetical protein GA0070216_1015 [Micromonospora matsumotoense]